MQERERRFAHNQNILNSVPPSSHPRPQHPPATSAAARDGYRGAPPGGNNYMDLRRGGRDDEEPGSDDYQRLSEVN